MGSGRVGGGVGGVGSGNQLWIVDAFKLSCRALTSWLQADLF